MLTRHWELISACRVREVSREIGLLAMQRMQERQDRWRSKTTENPKLKNLQHHQVNSAIEMVVNEGLESKYHSMDARHPVINCLFYS